MLREHRPSEKRTQPPPPGEGAALSLTPASPSPAGGPPGLHLPQRLHPSPLMWFPENRHPEPLHPEPTDPKPQSPGGLRTACSPSFHLLLLFDPLLGPPEGPRLGEAGLPPGHSDHPPSLSLRKPRQRSSPLREAPSGGLAAPPLMPLPSPRLGPPRPDPWGSLLLRPALLRLPPPPYLLMSPDAHLPQVPPPPTAGRASSSAEAQEQWCHANRRAGLGPPALLRTQERCVCLHLSVCPSTHLQQGLEIQAGTPAGRWTRG